MSRLQIHLPISPTPSFFTMVQYFAASLRRHGGKFAGARLVVSVGEDCEPFDIEASQPQLRKYGITWRWVDREAYRRHTYFATGMDRWAEPFEADYVLMADADMLVVGDFSDAAARLSEPLGIGGVEATMPPWLGRCQGDVDRERWAELFARAGLAAPVFDCPHPGHGVYYPAGSGMERGPVYYSFGFVLGTRQAMNAIATTFASDYLLAADFMKTDLAGQAGLTLSIVRHGIPYLALPVRYNFWADERHYEAFPGEAAEVRVLHYLNGPLSKARDIESPAAVAAWLRERRGAPAGHARFLRDTVAKAHAAVRPRWWEFRR